MIPNQIKYFEWSFLISMGIAIITSIIILINSSQPLAAGIIGVPILGFYIGVVLLFVFFTSRKRSKIAKWVLIVFFVLDLIYFMSDWVLNWQFFLQNLELETFLSIIQIMAHCCGMFFLFTKASRDWLEIDDPKTNK